MRTATAFAASLLGVVLMAPVLLIMVPLWMIAACTRALARVFERSYVTRDQLIEFDPAFGWKARPNLDTNHLMVDLFRIATDAQGWRGRATLAESEVVVFGDSFAAGYGVSEEHLFANLRPRPRIKPIGIGGYSMVQELLWMRALAPELAGKLVVWFVYEGNDLYDNLSPELRGYRKPFVREVRGTGEWEIVSSHVTSDRWPIVPRVASDRIHLVKLAEICSETFLADRVFRACDYLIREARQICADAGADLIVLSIQDPHQLSAEGHRYLQALAPNLRGFNPDAPGGRLEAICRRHGVSVVSGKSFLDMSCYKKNDCHWNEAGHRKVAEWLADVYVRRRRELGIASVLRQTALPVLNAVAKS